MTFKTGRNCQNSLTIMGMKTVLLKIASVVENDSLKFLTDGTRGLCSFQSVSNLSHPADFRTGNVGVSTRKYRNTSHILLRSNAQGQNEANNVRSFSTSDQVRAIQDTGANKYKVLVLGGGSGGCSVAAKYARKLGAGQVGVIEPTDTHYYQPMWTLVGAGVKTVNDSAKSMADVLPGNATWIRDSVESFNPGNNSVTTAQGREISYDYLVVALGMQLNYNKIKGLPEAFKVDKRLCSNYCREKVESTYPALQAFKGGNAIFTFPNTPVKCAGAPQKIMYLAENFFRNEGKRDNTNIIFNSSLGLIFGVKKYADSLTQVIKDRNIQVNFKRSLVEVRPETSEAVFEKLDSDSGETETFKYDFMHITPPMSAPDVLRQSPLVDAAGYLNIKKDTLQHVEFPNIFGIGDCTNLPTSKTAAAAAAQSGILKKNLDAVMEDRSPEKQYDGYTSCPLITGYGKCILAEFNYNSEPLETFPIINQAVERRTMYHLKKDVMPSIYWQLSVKGRWEGPALPRKAMSLGLRK